MHEEEYRPIDDFLRRFMARLKRVEVLEALCRAATALAVLAALGAGVEHLKGRLPYAPLAFSVLSIVTLLALAGFTLRCFLRRRGLAWAARAVERQRPELRNNLINSLQLYPQLAQSGDGGGVSTPMILALIRQTRGQVDALEPARLVDARPLRAKARLLALAAAPVIALALWHPDFPARTLALVAHPLEHLPPAATFIHVVTRDVRVDRGDGVPVEAITTGARPDVVELVFRPAADGNGDGESQAGTPNDTDSAASMPMAPTERRSFAMDGAEGRIHVSRLPEVTEDLDYRVVTGPFASPWYRITVVDRPRVTGIEVTIHPPHYTGLPDETFNGGNVVGIKGSTLSFSVTANTAMAEAVLAFGVRQGSIASMLIEAAKLEGQEVPNDLVGSSEVPLEVTGDTAQGSLVLFRSQPYHIRLKDAFGFENILGTYFFGVDSSGRHYRQRSLCCDHYMAALPDDPPVVELLKPSEDLDVNGDERIALEYRARDDFGLREVTLVAAIGEREERISMWRAEPTGELRETFIWDLDRMRLEEGDVVVYHVEALDNDTISGPKLARSQPRSLRLKNLEAEHRQVAEMIRGISDRMLDLLGDHLEAPPDQPAADPPVERLAEGLDRMMQRVDEAMQHTREVRVSDYATWADLETLKRNLRHAREDAVERMRRAASPGERARAHDDVATELERLSMLSENVSRRLTGQDMATNARDMVRNQERFLDSLEKLRSGDKELDDVLEDLSRMAQQLQELQASLMQFARQMPDEFVNPSSMRDMPFSDFRSLMEQIRQKLQEGDIGGALQMARDLFNRMAQFAAMLRGGQQQTQGGRAARMQGALSQASNELAEILTEQQDILLGTDRAHKEIVRRVDEIREQATEELAAGARVDLAVLERLLGAPDLESDRRRAPDERERNETIRGLLDELRGVLEKRDFDALSGRLGPTTEALAGMGALDPGQAAALEMLTGLARAYEAIAALPGPEPTPDQAAAMRSLATREDVLERRTRDLVDRLRHLFQVFPSLDPEIVNGIAAAREFMGQARHELGSLRPAQAIPPEQQAIDRLSASSRQMQQAMERLAQRGRFGRIPLMHVFRRGRFLPTGEFLPPTGTAQFPEHDIDESLTGLNTEGFKLPGKDDYRPDRFREEVMESLKEDVPEQYREQIERYFRELSQ